MDYQRQSNGWMTFLEHYWFFVIAISAGLGWLVLSAFSRLTGAPWIWCYGAGLLAAAVGVSLIFYAKIPLYRERQFFTFGSAALPESRRAAYRWGYRCVIFATVLLSILYLSAP